MLLANAPSKIVLAFAADGNKNTIPVPSQISVTPGAASWTDGFPPVTMLDPTEGGVGPSGLDFNGVFNALSGLDVWYSAGGAFPYDATFAESIGGYPKGARLLQAAGIGYWINTVDNNLNDPDTLGGGWVPEGAGTTSSVFASAQQTLALGTTKIIFDTIEFDSGMWDAANHRFKALYAGKYRVTGSVLMIAPGGQNFSSLIYTNGALAKQTSQFPQVSDGNLSFTYDAVLNLAVGDFVELFLLTTQSAVLAGIVGSNQPFVFAQLEYIGT